MGDANGYDDWPVGRGIFFSNDKKFLVWVNEEDHLRIISMQNGGNLAEVWQRLVKVRFIKVNSMPFRLEKIRFI